MKNKHVVYPIAIGIILLIIDQWSKVYVKTHFNLSEEVNVAGNWFKLHFLENYGMAFGIEFGGDWGKIILTLFRIIFCGVIVYYINGLIKAKSHFLVENLCTPIRPTRFPQSLLAVPPVATQAASSVTY